MKVFKITCDEFYYAFSGFTKNQAIRCFNEEIGGGVEEIEEIPESEWDENIIKVYEDNNLDTEPFLISIRDALIGINYPHLIYTNDFSAF